MHQRLASFFVGFLAASHIFASQPASAAETCGTVAQYWSSGCIIKTRKCRDGHRTYFKESKVCPKDWGLSPARDHFGRRLAR